MNLSPLQIWELIKTARGLSRAQWAKFAGVVATAFAGPLASLAVSGGITGARVETIGMSALVVAVGWLEAQSQEPVIGRRKQPAEAAGGENEASTRSSL